MINLFDTYDREPSLPRTKKRVVYIPDWIAGSVEMSLLEQTYRDHVSNADALFGDINIHYI